MDEEYRVVYVDKPEESAWGIGVERTPAVGRRMEDTAQGFSDISLFTLPILCPRRSS
jgi:hypothetical protein